MPHLRFIQKESSPFSNFSRFHKKDPSPFSYSSLPNSPSLPRFFHQCKKIYGCEKSNRLTPNMANYVSLLIVGVFISCLSVEYLGELRNELFNSAHFALMLLQRQIHRTVMSASNDKTSNLKHYHENSYHSNTNDIPRKSARDLPSKSLCRMQSSKSNWNTTLIHRQFSNIQLSSPTLYGLRTKLNIARMIFNHLLFLLDQKIKIKDGKKLIAYYGCFKLAPFWYLPIFSFLIDDVGFNQSIDEYLLFKEIRVLVIHIVS